MPGQSQTHHWHHLISIRWMRSELGWAAKALLFPLHGNALCNIILQICCSLETQYHGVFNFLQFCRYLSSIFCPYASLSLKDAELRSSNQGSQQKAEEPQEPVSPEVVESIQVTDIIPPCLRPRRGPGGCLCHQGQGCS